MMMMMMMMMMTVRWCKQPTGRAPSFTDDDDDDYDDDDDDYDDDDDDNNDDDDDTDPLSLDCHFAQPQVSERQQRWAPCLP